jgi:acetyltransferase-like isoleucine patch superfamily enzyme
MLRCFTRKLAWKLVGSAIAVLGFVHVRTYMRCYLWYLRRRGMRISGTPRYIAVKCWFDGEGGDYHLIELGHNVVISSNVRILTHDYSIARAFVALGVDLDTEVANVRPISIGDNCFVGTGSILMPGCRLGRNVIVGAGSVVRGEVADNAIVMGNPAKVVDNTLEWGRQRLKLLEEGWLRKDPLWWGGLSGGERVATLRTEASSIR